MRRFMASVAMAVSLGTNLTLAEADPLKFSAVLLETAPLTLISSAGFRFEASLVNVGPNSATGFILFYAADTGQCVGGPGCQGVLLAPGHGCGSTVGGNGSTWARLILIRFGDKKPIEARGALQVQATGGGGGFARRCLGPARHS